MIVLITIIFIVIILILIAFKKGGYFGLYIEINHNRQKVYYWYKGNIIESFELSFDTRDDFILAILDYKNKAKAKIKNIKHNNKKYKL